MPDFGSINEPSIKDQLKDKFKEKSIYNRTLLKIFSNKIALFLLAIIPILTALFVSKYQLKLEKIINFIAPFYEFLGFILFAISDSGQPKGGHFYPEDWNEFKKKDILLRRFGYFFILLGFSGWIISSLL